MRNSVVSMEGARLVSEGVQFNRRVEKLCKQMKERTTNKPQGTGLNKENTAFYFEIVSHYVFLTDP